MLRLMIDDDELDDDPSLEEITVPDSPFAGKDIVGSGTLVNRDSPDIPVPPGVVSETNNRSGGSLNKTKKNSQVKVPNLYVGVEEKQQLLREQEATNKFHKFVDGNLILKQGVFIECQ